jgi:hypothetical protein
MKLKTLMIIKAVVCITLGALLLVVPGFVYSIFGASVNDGGAYAGREYGAALLGMFLLTWYARDAGESQGRRAIILHLFVYDALGVVITLIAQISGLFNALGWSVVALYLFFAVGYGYYWFAQPAQRQVTSAT